MSSEAVAGNMAVDLLEAGSEGRGDEIVGVLEVDLELIRVGDLNGDTVLHLLASGGYVEPLLQVLRFIHDKDPKLLKEVAKQGNAHGDTPLHLAVKNNHKRMAYLLVKVEGKSLHIENDDGVSPQKMVDDIWSWSFYELFLNMEASSDKEEMLLDEICNTHYRFDNQVLSPPNESKDTLGRVYEDLLNDLSGFNLIPEFNASFSDINMEIEIMENFKSVIDEGKIWEMIEVEPNLIRYKNRIGDTILHVLASSENMDKLTKLVGHLVTTSKMTRRDDRFQLPTLNLLLEGNKYGCTPLHQAIENGNMKASQYLIEIAPEAAYRVDNNGQTPLYVAMKKGHGELVNYMLQSMPEASMSPATRSSLLTPNRASVPHAAIKLRKLNMFQLLLESIPSLVDSLDEKGWKPLSYAAFKGYLDHVQYLLQKFPESVKKFDSDGSLPIHKAVSGGHVCIIKGFISIHPQTLHSIDMKGRNILHIAVKYRKADILRYLRDEVKGVEKLYDLRDNDDKTFADYTPGNN